MIQTLTSPFALCGLWHRSNPFSLTLRCHPHYVVASSRAKVFALPVIHPRLTGAFTVTLAVADEEINIILIPVIAVGDFVLAKQ